MTPQFFKSHHWGWGPLVLLVAVTQIGLLWLSIRHEQTRDQERLDGLAAEAVGEFRHRLRQDIDRLQDLIADAPAPERFSPAVATLLRERREVLRVETRSSAMALQRSVASQYGALPERSRLSREQQEGEQLAACRTAQHLGVPRLSRSYYMAAAAGGGAEVLDVCVPMIENRQAVGYLTATLDLPRLLEQVLGSRALRAYSLVLRDADGNRLANAGPRMDADAPAAQRLLEIAGLTLELQLRQRRHLPWMPQPALVLGLTLSLALAAVLVLLMRDVRRRTAAERELAEALALRRAMEDSLVTGLLARDLAGRLTYVNRAFCRMVDLPADALLGSLHPPCLAAPVAVAGARDDGRPHEAMLRRRDGTVFPVQLHDAPLLDAAQRQTGWLCAVVDVTAQRRADELLRQQQDTLQASARLAMMGEMASLLSHELNQPLTAIVGYANGTLNLLDELLTHPGAQEQAMLGHALQRIAEQGDRAGRVIKSVQDFVRRRETCREPRRADALIDGILPLVRLQARRSGAAIEVDVPAPAPWVQCDPTMIEQVLLNLARNGLQSMEALGGPVEQRVLRLQVSVHGAGRIEFAVTDRGTGVPDDIAARLFTPFFTTRPGGLGLGLSMCRTVIEQHAGELGLRNVVDAGRCTGACFHFTLPAARGSAAEPAPRPDQETLHAR